MKNKIFFAAMILMAASFIGIEVIDDSEESDAAMTYIFDVREGWDWANPWLVSGTSVAFAASTSVENGVTYGWSASPGNITMTNSDVTVLLTKTIHATGQVVDSKNVICYLNDQGYTFNSSVVYYNNDMKTVFDREDRSGWQDSLFWFVVTQSAPTPPTGATLIGWSKTPYSDTADYTANEYIVNQDYGMPLYPVYSSQTNYSYTVNFNANGGTGAPSSLTYTGTETYHTFTMPNTIPTPPTGATTFYGWSTIPNDSTPGIQPGSTYSVSILGGSSSSNITLYAVWDVPIWTVSFTVNNANYGSVYPTSISVANGASISHGNNVLYIGGIEITATHATGYEFIKWTSSIGGDDLGATITSNVTYTAHFGLESYVAYFDNQYSQHGTVSPASISNLTYGMPITVNYNQITINGTTVTATPDSGWSFDYWRSILPDTGTNIPSTVTGTMRIVAYFTQDHTFSLIYDMNGGSPQIPTDTWITPLDEVTFSVSYTIPTKNGYVFNGWTTDPSGTTAEYVGGDPITVSWNDGGSLTLYAIWTPGGQHVFNLSYDMKGGSPQFDTQSFTGSSSTYSHYFFIPSTVPTKEGYSFSGWSDDSVATNVDYLPNESVLVVWNSESLSGDMTLYAVWEEPEPPVIIDGVYWSNELYNGSVTLACRFTGGNTNAVHQINVPLYNGSVTVNSEPVWTRTAYEVEISISYPNTTVTVDLKNNGTTVQGFPITKNIGKWPGFELLIDADNGKIEFTPMDRFNNYTSYTTYSSRTETIADWSQITSGNAIYEIKHDDEGTGAPMSFQVVRTMTFLDTFGVVMTDPSINVYEYFPDYEKVRLNFYSFALYGDSMTINGKTFPVDEGSVTIYYYTTLQKANVWVASQDAVVPSPSGQNYVIHSKTLTLSNIYVTWNGDTCSLTFVNDKFTVELGLYSAGNETVSFTGFWYFTTTLYEPITVTEKSIEGGWKALPDIGGPAMILLYLGAILGLGLIAHIKIGLKWLDLTILTIGMVLGFALLG